ncbi:MAG: hypothetical protein MJ094_08535 [Saccharofermentans sp.]|nr:hypothetical protein [Saccharofermentans sp.]
MERLKKLNTAKMIMSIVGAAIQLVISIILLIVTIMTMSTNRSFGFGQFLLYNGLMLLSMGVFIVYIIINSIEAGKSKSILSGEKTFEQESKSLKMFAIVQIVMDLVVMAIYNLFFIIAIFRGFDIVLLTFAFGGLSSAVALINLIENGFGLKYLKDGTN